MTLTGTSARFELIASADLTSQHTIGSATIGTPLSTVTYATAPDIAYSLAMFITSGTTLTLNMATGAVTGTVTGTSQVETATVVAASGVTSNGICNVVFTAASVVGTPLTIPVSLTTAQTTATLIAVEIRAALAAIAAIAAEFTIGGTGATVTATRIKKRSNDSTLNIAIPAGLGITAAASSANTTTGVGESKAYRIDGMAWNQTDFEGKALTNATKLYSVMIRLASVDGIPAPVQISDSGFNKVSNLLKAGDVELSCAPFGDHQWAGLSVDFSPSPDVLLYIDIHAGT